MPDSGTTVAAVVDAARASPGDRRDPRGGSSLRSAPVVPAASGSLRLPELGAAWMIVAAFCFALMGLLVKLMGDRYSSTELVFYRSLVGFAAIAVMAAPRLGDVITPHWRLHLKRSVSGLLGLWLYFYALTRLPLATAVTLNYTSPLFLAIFAVGLLGERARPALLAALGIGFLGVVLLLKPHIERDQLTVGLVGLASGMFSGLAYVQVRAMGALREPEWRIVLYFTLFSSLISGLALLLPLLPIHGLPPVWQADPPHAVHGRDLPLLAGIGLTALLGQLCMTRAYRTGALLLASNFAYSAIVFSSLFGVIFHHDWLSPMAWTGMLVIIAGGVLASLARSPAPSPSEA